MMNNRQNSAFRELIEKEQKTKELWSYTHGRTIAFQNGEGIPDGGALVSGDEFLSTRVPPGVALPPPNPLAQEALKTGKQIQEPVFATADIDSEVQFPVVRKKVIRRVEVPVTREVKVPIKLIPNMTSGKGELYHVRAEKYVDYEERPAVRNREVWVKKVVSEPYMAKVPVTKVRQVKVPVAEGVGYKVVAPNEADAYRIDTVQETKVVDVEEWADFELRPVAVGNSVPIALRDVPPKSGVPIAAQNLKQHRVVQGIYKADNPRVREVSILDDTCQPGSMFVPKPAAGDSATSSSSNSLATSTPSSSAASKLKAMAKLGSTSFSSTNSSASAVLVKTGTASLSSKYAPLAAPKPQAPFVPSASKLLGPLPPRQGENKGAFAKLAIKVRAVNPSSAIASSVPTGAVVVVALPADGAATRVGLAAGDVISHVNNRPTKDAQSFEGAIEGSDGPIAFRVIRNGSLTKIIVPRASFQGSK